MAINTTRWSPDTCSCIIEYVWDSAVPQDQRIHTISQVINSCIGHNGLSNKDVHGVLVSENSLKNKTFVVAQTIVSILTSNDMEFSFTGSGKTRQLTVNFPTISIMQKQMILTAVNTVFGAGVVVIA